MSRPTRRRPPVVAGLLVAALALVLAGCSGRVQGPRDWTMTSQLVSGGSQTVTVHDTSGRVDNAEIDPSGVAVTGPILSPAGQANVVLVPWTGGACDQLTQISIAGNGPGLALTFRITTAPGVCDAIGVGHVLRLTASVAVPAAAVSITRQP